MERRYNLEIPKLCPSCPSPPSPTSLPLTPLTNFNSSGVQVRGQNQNQPGMSAPTPQTHTSPYTAIPSPKLGLLDQSLNISGLSSPIRPERETLKTCLSLGLPSPTADTRPSGSFPVPGSCLLHSKCPDSSEAPGSQKFRLIQMFNGTLK